MNNAAVFRQSHEYQLAGELSLHLRPVVASERGVNHSSDGGLSRRCSNWSQKLSQAWVQQRFERSRNSSCGGSGSSKGQLEPSAHTAVQTPGGKGCRCTCEVSMPSSHVWVAKKTGTTGRGRSVLPLLERAETWTLQRRRWKRTGASTPKQSSMQWASCGKMKAHNADQAGGLESRQKLSFLFLFAGLRAKPTSLVTCTRLLRAAWLGIATRLRSSVRRTTTCSTKICSRSSWSQCQQEGSPL